VFGIEPVQVRPVAVSVRFYLMSARWPAGAATDGQLGRDGDFGDLGAGVGDLIEELGGQVPGLTPS